MNRPHRLSAAEATRRLTHPQLAFVRAWAEGVDLQQAAQRYLDAGGGLDARQARAELQALLDLLRNLARAHGRADLAALLRRDPATMVEAVSKAPSLDDFRAQQPEDFYSEAELLELYTATHGAPDARSGARRRQRLRARQLAALQWLEGVAVREPQPADRIASWLDERLAARLAAVGLVRLEQLHAWIRRRGYHWHRAVPKVGAVAAARLLAWWRQHVRTLGALPVWTRVAPRQLDRSSLLQDGSGQLATAAQGGRLAGPPLPLERLSRLSVPAALSGRQGVHRAAVSPTGPDDDLAAVQAWLARRVAGSATWRAYRKEAERLLLWAWWVAGKPVSSLQTGDLAAYQAFLAAPPAGWTAPRGTPRWHEDWRPFEGGLSPRSAQMALGIVCGMLDAWVEQGYLAVNSWTGKPWTVSSRTVGTATSVPTSAFTPAVAASALPAAAMPAAAGVAPAAPARLAPAETGPAPGARPSEVRRLPDDGASGGLRALSSSQAMAMHQWIERQAQVTGGSAAWRRLHALWALAWTSGMRPAELVAARVGWLRRPGPATVLASGVAPGVSPPRGRAADGQAGAGAGAWELHIPSNATAGAARRLTLPPQAQAALQRYLADRGLPFDGAAEDEAAAGAEAPLVAQLRTGRPLSSARLYELMSEALRACADGLGATDPDAAAALRRASTHWLRHGFGLEVARSGAPAAELQRRMGHRSRASSARYQRAARPAPAPAG